MNHRVVTAAVGLIIAMLAITALSFAGAIQVRVPMSAARQATPVTIPHPTSARNDACTSCHSGAGVPLTHRHFTNRTCLSCHSRRPITLVPHSISMGIARCSLCHGDVASDLGMPSDHLAFKEHRCLFCHPGDEAKASAEPRPAGAAARLKPATTHPVTGAFAHCLYCHRVDGNPSLLKSHDAFTEETCLWCHVPTRAEATR